MEKNVRAKQIVEGVDISDSTQKNMELVAVSDFYKLAVLDLYRVIPIRAEHTGRYWAYFSKEDAQKLIDEYESGHLKVVARDFVSSISRVKDRIFELERTHHKSGDQNGITRPR